MSTESANDPEYGVLEETEGTSVVRFERRLKHPMERVWQALTQPDEMRAWWGDADIDLVVGGTFVVRWLNTDDQGNGAVMHATITQLDPPHLLETNGDIHGVLRWELTPDGAGTLLRFSSTMDDLSEEFRTSVMAGWHIHLDYLAEALEGGAVDWPNWTMEQWERAHEHYVSVYGG